MFMGKTKTAFVEGATEETKSGKAAYEEKMRKKAAAQKEVEEKAKAQVKGVGLKGGERIKVVGGETPVRDEKATAEGVTEREVDGKKTKQPKIRSKKYTNAKKKIDRNKTYKIDDAIKLVKEASYSKFDGTMELHLVTKKDKITERVSLPFAAGKQKKIEVADDNTVAKLKKGNVDFDILLATPNMMPKLVPFAKLLGPKGLLPNPKTGTLIKDIKDAAKFSGNTMTLKTEKSQPVIHTVCGKVSQKDTEIAKNIEAIMSALGGSKQISKAYLKSTMSPSVKLNI